MLYKLEVFLKDSVHQSFKNMVSMKIKNNLKNTFLDCKNELIEKHFDCSVWSQKNFTFITGSL